MLRLRFRRTQRIFQTVTIQGQVTYRVADAKKLAAVLDLSVVPNGVYRTDDYQKLPERLVRAIQTLMRAEVQKMELREALTGSGKLNSQVCGSAKVGGERGAARSGDSEPFAGVYPADAGDGKSTGSRGQGELQRRSDEAIYARRNNAVEQERRLKESELNTEIAVEEKQRQIREDADGG